MSMGFQRVVPDGTSSPSETILNTVAPVLGVAVKRCLIILGLTQLAIGRLVRILSVVDAHTRECLALETDASLGNRHVTRVLERLIEGRAAGRRTFR